MRQFKYFKESIVYSLFFCMSICVVVGQDLKIYNPLQENKIQGRVKEMVGDFGRLPVYLKDEVRQPVWSLGQNSAGLYVDFKTNAASVVVQYAVAGALSMPHMPTTGVSGVDLYVQEAGTNTWSWAYGNYSFKDTIKYSFENIGSDKERIYRLYLPLYNTVKWLEIAVSGSAKFEFLSMETKPIVIYGTSIAQGACVSRPGMGWTNILGRSVSNEVINLAFSGNGRLEQPLLDLMAKEDAAVFVLDCIPNLSISKNRTEEHLDSLIDNAVTFMRSKHPTIPIILTAHSSANTEGFLNIAKVSEYTLSTQVARASFDKLVKRGVKNLHWLSEQEIGFDINSTVDYAHPNDYGMLKIAEAYRKLLKKIL